MRPSKGKSRTFRRVYVKTPGGETKLHYRKRKPKIAKCSICKKPLHGIPRLKPTKFKNIAKTKKRPNRKFGGNLCSKCTKRVMIEKLRG